MEGGDAIKGIIGVLVVTGVVIVPVAQTLSSESGTLSTETIIGMLDTQTNLIKLATKADNLLKYTATTLLEMGALSPHERALYPNTLTDDDLKRLADFLESTDNDASFIQDVYPHCQKWLAFAEVGKTKFEATPDIIEAYYSSMTQEKISSLRPAARVSEALNNKLETVKAFCGGTCISTVECGECWDIRLNFQKAQGEGDLDAILETATEMREKGCAISCAQVCSSVYNTLSAISGTTYVGMNFGGESNIEDARVKMDFIDIGIGLP